MVILSCRCRNRELFSKLLNQSKSPIPGPSLTIFIPALNEEDRLPLTVNELLPLARATCPAFEVLIVNDGSTDRTGFIADTLAREHSEIAAIHHSRPIGLGASFKEALATARCESLTLIPGDHVCNTDSLRPMFEAVGSADLILGYRTNQSAARSRTRAIISRIYNMVMRTLFRFPVTDFHCVAVYPARALREIELPAVGYTFQIEAIITLLRRNYSFREVPVALNKEGPGTSRSLRFKTFRDLVAALWHLLRHRH